MAELAASGLNPEQLALVLELSATVAAEARPAEDVAARRRRERDREYQAERRRNRQMSADSDDKGSLEVSPHTPLPNPSKSSPLNPPIFEEKKQAVGSCLRKAYQVEHPDWLPESFAEFRAMRKRMRNVPFEPGAERRCILKLEKLRAEGHDPEKLLSKAIENGHRTFFPDESTKADPAKAYRSPADQVEVFRRWITIYEDKGDKNAADEMRRKVADLEEANPQLKPKVANLLDRVAGEMRVSRERAA